jgi:hypothetical protein
LQPAAFNTHGKSASTGENYHPGPGLTWARAHNKNLIRRN